MQDYTVLLPWLFASVLYFEYGRLWLRIITLTDPTSYSGIFTNFVNGDGSPDEVWSARVVAASVIVGWPAFMIYGRVNGWKLDRKEARGE